MVTARTLPVYVAQAVVRDMALTGTTSTKALTILSTITVAVLAIFASK